MAGERFSARKVGSSCFESVSWGRNFRREETRWRFDSRHGEIRSRRGFCSEFKRVGYEEGIVHEKRSDHGFKWVRYEEGIVHEKRYDRESSGVGYEGGILHEKRSNRGFKRVPYEERIVHEKRYDRESSGVGYEGGIVHERRSDHGFKRVRYEEGIVHEKRSNHGFKRARYEEGIVHEKRHDHGSDKVRCKRGILHEKRSDHESKEDRVCEVVNPVEERLLPLKKRKGFRFSVVPPDTAKSTVKRLNLVGLAKLDSRPLQLPPALRDLEEGEIVEESRKLSPFVEPKGGEITEESVAVKAVSAIPRSRDPIQNCTRLSEYRLLGKINEGAYGVVYKAMEQKTGKIVALKRMKHEKGKTGLPLAAWREIKILFSLNHPSVLSVKEVVKGEGDDFFMAMEFMEQDLNRYIKSRKQGFSTGEVKGLMLQLLEGVLYVHQNKILHRDLKTANLLLNSEGKVKICDFGLSCRETNDGKPLTSLVVTLWYRAPELLLGATRYSKEIDMWSVGCIMAELLKKEPLFRGKSEIDQVNSIVTVLGTPTLKNWPGMSTLPGISSVTFVKQPENQLRQKFPILSEMGLDLLKGFLTYDPRRRITAKSALQHPWFSEFPHPKPLRM
ncbi:hypothetical protein SLEP1_g52428 [Rubroshorea leprosula]|uniref:Protein kinase domain-containing protein n=1 Tax=Rubroshorea leprosula TaxID=152421 RepID=A0AAV5M670_9ROSI|nr:hypothetical protein SLEP1_g52428 [Rubroshorea leprosula]